jgi:hypothetical protein
MLACGPNETILKSNPKSSPETNGPQESNVGSRRDTAEDEIENMRTADFDFIFVLRRKDGGRLDSDDKAFIRANTANVNRRSLPGDGMAAVIGSNFRLPQAAIEALKSRFDVQDFSGGESQINPSNARPNANMVR